MRAFYTDSWLLGIFGFISLWFEMEVVRIREFIGDEILDGMIAKCRSAERWVENRDSAGLWDNWGRSSCGDSPRNLQGRAEAHGIVCRVQWRIWESCWVLQYPWNRPLLGETNLSGTISTSSRSSWVQHLVFDLRLNFRHNRAIYVLQAHIVYNHFTVSVNNFVLLLP
jgi:hypothetical protein